MSYQLYVGNRLYFSWSIAAYLMFNRFGLEDQVRTTIFRPESEAALRPLMADLAPARTLPTVIAPDGARLRAVNIRLLMQFSHRWRRGWRPMALTHARQPRPMSRPILRTRHCGVGGQWA